MRGHRWRYFRGGNLVWGPWRILETGKVRKNLPSGRFEGGQTFPGVFDERPESGIAVFPEVDEFFVVLSRFTV
jgi:hypothetical protein